MSVYVEHFGTTENGVKIDRITLTNASGMSVSVLNYGATIQSIMVSDKDGNKRDVCLGYDNLKQYEEGKQYIGATVGRYANRIAGGKFTLNGKTYNVTRNEGNNTLHGGDCLNHKTWHYTINTDQAVKLECSSSDGENGFPGDLHITMILKLKENNDLVVDYYVVTSADTVVNLTNHAYFNLNGDNNGDILGHNATIFASNITEVDAESIPTGKLLPVVGTPFDFQNGETIGARIHDDNKQLRYGSGYDHNFVLDSSDALKAAARVYSEESGISLTVYTTLPGMQFYTGNFIPEQQGKNGTYNKHSGFCLETQFFPDSPNHPEFPSATLKTGEVFHHSTTYRFGLV